MTFQECIKDDHGSSRICLNIMTFITIIESKKNVFCIAGENASSVLFKRLKNCYSLHDVKIECTSALI